MILKGKVYKFGDDVNTDEIIPAKFLVTTDPRELGKNCMEGIRPGFSNLISSGDIIVAGKNFGCGSSREHAPLSIKGSGVSCVIAKSFARIFYRNSINIGLPILESDDIDKISEGDLLEIDLSGGIIKNLSKNKIYRTQAFPDFLREIVRRGGLMNWIKRDKKGKNLLL